VKHSAAAGDERTRFAWTVVDDVTGEIALLIRVPPAQSENAQTDMHQLVEMLRTAGLQPTLTEWRVRLDRRPPLTVTVAWRGIINDVTSAEELLNVTARIWQNTGRGQELA
jgi:hypothetical protein